MCGGEGDGGESQILWNDLDRIVYILSNGYRLCVLVDLNGWVGDRIRVDLKGAFGVLGENDNERRVVKFCAKRGLCVDNTYFEHESLHKYTGWLGTKMEWR